MPFGPLFQVFRGFVESPRISEKEVEGTLHGRFRKIAGRFSEGPAVCTEDAKISYALLDGWSDAIALSILEKTGPGAEPVALLFPPGVEGIAALLGVLKSGKFYAPLDSRNPPARNRDLIEHLGARLVLTTKNRLGALESGTGVRVEAIPDATPAKEAELDSIKCGPYSIAYVLFTSGSTGAPKGVIQTHRNVLADIRRQAHDLRTTPRDRFGLVYPIGSSASICHIFGALLNGARLYPFDLQKAGFQETANWLVRRKITVLDINVSVFRHVAPLMPLAGARDSLRILSPGSEPVLRRDFDLYRKYFNDRCIIQNAFGSTETRTATQQFLTKNSKFEGDLVPLGKEVQSKRVRILDDDGTEVPAGEIGEIAIESSYISPGYWRRSELTEAAFRPATEKPGETLYLTGDLGRRMKDGTVIHLGRKDFQVKIRGHRVELGEVEQRLCEHPAVQDAAAAAHPDKYGNPRLHGYVVMDPSRPAGIRELREFAAERLPDYMIPTSWQFLDGLPQTLTGKLDRNALAACPSIPRTAAEITREMSSHEALLNGMWKSVLGLDQIGVDEDFFELGGDSILAGVLFQQIEENFGVRAPIGIFHEISTISALGSYLEILDGAFVSGQTARIAGRSFAWFNEAGTRAAVVLCPGADAAPLTMRRLSQLLGPDQPVCVPIYKGLQEGESPDEDIPTMAGRIASGLADSRFQGTFRVAGFSAGGLVAYELAQQLLSRGEAVRFLGLIDTPPRSSRRFIPLIPVSEDSGLKSRWKGIGASAPIRSAPGSGRPPVFRSDSNPSADRVYRTHLTSLYSAHVKAAEAYKATPISTPVALFRATGRRDEESWMTEDMGWANFAVAGLNVIRVDGAHHLIREPYVRELAPKFREALEQAADSVSTNDGSLRASA